MTTITGISTAQNVYTEKGNTYKKTNKGKEAGTVAGAFTAGVCLEPFGKTFNTLLFQHTLRQEKKLAEEAAEAAKAIAEGKMVNKVVFNNKVSDAAMGFIKTTPGRVLAAAAFASAVIGAGKVLGSIADGIVNKAAQFRADKQAEQKEAIIKEFEASKSAE